MTVTLAKRTRDATQSRRLLALAEVYDGGAGGCVADRRRRSAIRDWVLRFNWSGKSPG